MSAEPGQNRQGVEVSVGATGGPWTRASALQRGRYEEDHEGQQHDGEHGGTEEVPKTWLHGWRSSPGSTGRVAEPYSNGARVVAPG